VGVAAGRVAVGPGVTTGGGVPGACVAVGGWVTVGVGVTGRALGEIGVFGPPATGVFGPRPGVAVCGVAPGRPGVTGVAVGLAPAGAASLFGSDVAPEFLSQAVSVGLFGREL
jgi:hypothetical protein